MIDTFGRLINYARLSVTDLCNLRCIYCMPKLGIENKCSHCDILRIEDFEKIVEALSELGVEKIRITGGEPLVRKGIEQLLETIGNTKGIKHFGITTNAVLLEQFAKTLENSKVTGVNISLDTLNPEKYKYITRGGDIKTVFKGLRKVMDTTIPNIKINTVLIKGFNDDEIEDFVKLTNNNKIDVRFIELMSIGSQVEWASDKYLSCQTVLDKCSELELVENKNLLSPAVYYKLEAAKGRVGLINPLSCNFCNSCNRIRFTAEGKIKPCLHSDDDISVREFLNDKEQLKKVIIQSVLSKPEKHGLCEGKYITRNMSTIGG